MANWWIHVGWLAKGWLLQWLTTLNRGCCHGDCPSCWWMLVNDGSCWIHAGHLMDNLRNMMFNLWVFLMETNYSWFTIMTPSIDSLTTYIQWIYSLHHHLGSINLWLNAIRVLVSTAELSLGSGFHAVLCRLPQRVLSGADLQSRFICWLQMIIWLESNYGELW